MIHQWKIEKAIERTNYQVERYPKVMREYIQPYTRVEDMMRRTSQTLHRFDEDRTFLATKISEFIQELEKVPDDSLSESESIRLETLMKTSKVTGSLQRATINHVAEGGLASVVGILKASCIGQASNPML